MTSIISKIWKIRLIDKETWFQVANVQGMVKYISIKMMKASSAVDKLKKVHKFSKQELNYLSRMEKYLMEKSVLNVQGLTEIAALKHKPVYEENQ